MVIDETGRISFNLLQHHRSQAQALVFYVFDVLIHGGKSRLSAPLEERRRVLGGVFDKLGRKAATIKLSETIDATPAELVRVAKEFGFEGIVAKRRERIAIWQAKRCLAQVSYQSRPRVCDRRICSANPLDSIIVGYYEVRKLLYAAKVRNGFVPPTRRAVAAKLRGRKIAACPFANLPERKRTQWALTKEKMKNCTWVRREIVAQIEFAEWTPDGHLRHSKFVGLRDDKDARSVTREE